MMTSSPITHHHHHQNSVKAGTASSCCRSRRTEEEGETEEETEEEEEERRSVKPHIIGPAMAPTHLFRSCRSSLFSCIFLLLLASRSARSYPPQQYPDLDPSEIEALGLTEEETSESFHNHGNELNEEENDDEIAGGEEPDQIGSDFNEEEDNDFSSSSSSSSFDFSIEDDQDVVVLSSSNFSDFIASNKFVLVEFYAPWCGHCQSLAPEYAVAATKLKPEGVSLAKVDATKEGDLAQLHEVQGYPTMIFFSHGKSKPYSHHRTSDAIIAWVKKNIGPAVTDITTTDEAKTILETGNTIAVAVFDKLEGTEVEEYASIAQQDDDLTFYQTASREVAEIFHLKKEIKTQALVLIKSAAEKIVPYYGKFDATSISEFILANKLPLVSIFNRDTASPIFESPIKDKILLFASPEDALKLLPGFEEAAAYFKGKIIFCYVDSADEEIGKPVAEFFGVTIDRPKAVAFTVTDEQPVKYLFEDEVTAEKIKEFVTNFLEGKLEAFYKSEPLPETNEDDVKVVVANNFNDIVLDESKDVLLEIYAPWCGHCQSLEPVYNKLAKALSSVKSLVIAKMDGTANEHPRGKAEGYPTLLLFPAGNKSVEPIAVEAERSVKGLYQFLKQNVAIPFTLSKSGGGETASTIETKVDASTSDNTKDEL